MASASPPLLDNQDIEKVLFRLNNPAQADDAELARTVAIRIRYLQVREFPGNARPGRGKRTEHDLDGVLQLAIAFELLGLGLSPLRVIATVRGNWWIIARVMVTAWRSLRLLEEETPSPKMSVDLVERLRGILLLEPTALAGEDAPIPVAIGRPDEALWRDPLGSGSPRSALLLDPLRLLAELFQALRNELNYTDADLDAGMLLVGAAAFSNSDEATWIIAPAESVGR